MSDYQNIIEDIKKGLTSDSQKDHEYLLEQTEKYKQHPMSHEILKEIGRMMYEIIPEEGKKELSNTIDKELDSLNAKIQEANSYILQKDFTKAKELLNEYLEAALAVYKEDQVTRYFSFKDVVEFYCSKGVIDTDKKVIWVDLRYDVAYKLLGYIASEEKQFDKAIECLNKGLYYNPMSTEIRFEKAESYKMQHDLEKMLEATKEIYDYILEPISLAKYYRLLGYYYIEKNQLDIAYSVYALSIHYENSEMAHSEIAYIRHQLGNPDYDIPTKEIIENLNKENIPTAISLQNIAKLRQLASEKDLQEKVPELIEDLNNVVNLMSTPLDPNQTIEGLKVSTPKITSEDIFDENKLILDEVDKTRVNKNIEVLKKNNIPYMENLKVIPTNSTTNLKTQKEILDRALVDYVVASMTVYALEGKSAAILNILDEMDSKLQIKKVLADGDIKFIQAIHENKISKQELQDVSWVFEECAALLWALGLYKKPASDKECNVNELDELMFNSTSYEELLSKCTLKTKEEILEFADLIFRYSWACREMRMKGQPLSKLNEMIVQEQRRALEWILNWKIEKIMKDHSRIKYEKDDLNFEYDMPISLKFSEVNSTKDPQKMFTLTDSRRSIIINFLDCGRGNSEIINTEFDDLVNHYKNEGNNIIGRYDLSASNLNGKIKQLLSNRAIPNQENKLIGISRYYFILSNHIVCLECIMLDENINYQDVNSILNSESNSIITGILFSIHEIKDNDINTTQLGIDLARITNYQLHAEQLDIPVLNNFKIEDNPDPKMILSATNGMYVEMLLTDGTLNQNETFEQRINLVNKNVIEFLKKQSPLNNDKCMFYYKDYTNGIFNYKIYVEEMFFEVDGIKKVIRQLTAYFVEPNYNDFYQLTISSPALQMPTEILKIGEVDLEHDQITNNLYLMLKVLMDNLKYKNNSQDNKQYSDTMNMNGIEVPFNKAAGQDGVITADPNQLYKAAIESSVIANLNIEETEPNIIDNVKNLYRMILVCGEFEIPIIDEEDLEALLKDNNKVIELVKKFNDVNKNHFNSELKYLTFNIDDNHLLNKLIDVLKKSFKKN